jgi:hypothetical protein
MFDILIVVAQKDFNKLPFVLEAIDKNILDINKYHLISPVAIPDEYIWIDSELHTDDEVIDFDFTRINMEARRGWYRQQFIKLFQTVTTDNYLVIDADTIINKKLEINPAHPSFYFGKDQYHLPYFEAMKRIAGIDKVYPHSFITEIMFFKRGILNYMLNTFRIDKYDFFDRCVDAINIINNASGFSEYEFYGNYVMSNWLDFYKCENINVMNTHKKRVWTDDEVSSCVQTYSNSNYDLFTMHSWI